MTTTGPDAVEGGRARIAALDVLRGFALCGILLVNIEPLSRSYTLPTLEDASGWLQLLVQQRFFPIFSLLFGVGFALLLESAQRRGARPRVVLLRRLLVLLPLGFLHQLLQPGEALLVYAVLGLVVLLPSTWLPRWAVAAAGAVLVVAAAAVGAGGLLLVPGLLLTGSALVRYGVVDRMGTSTRVPAVLFTAFALASVPALARQLDDLASSHFTTSAVVAGLSMAGAYVTGILVLLRTRLRGALHAVFAPLGRMALTNYVSATPIVLAASSLLDWQDGHSWTQMLSVAVAVLALQWVVSTLWLRRFRQGPLEWLWRWATWASRPVLRREVPHAVSAGRVARRP